MRWRTVFGASVITGALGILLVAQLSSGTEGEPAPPRQPPLEGTSLVVAPHCAPPGRERTVTLTSSRPTSFLWGMDSGRIEHAGRTTHIVSFGARSGRLLLTKVEDVPHPHVVLGIGYVLPSGGSATWRFTPPRAGDSTMVLGVDVSTPQGAEPHDIVASFRTSYSC